MSLEFLYGTGLRAGMGAVAAIGGIAVVLDIFPLPLKGAALEWCCIKIAAFLDKADSTSPAQHGVRNTSNCKKDDFTNSSQGLVDVLGLHECVSFSSGECQPLTASQIHQMHLS